MRRRRIGLPGRLHFLSTSPTPTFSILRLRSKIFFSSRIFSIVRSPLETVPASGGSPASLMNVSSVYQERQVAHDTITGSMRSNYLRLGNC